MVALLKAAAMSRSEGRLPTYKYLQRFRREARLNYGWARAGQSKLGAPPCLVGGTTRTTDVALFVDRGLGAAGVGQQLFLSFVGGPDDRLALTFLVQLCANPGVVATVVWINKTEAGADNNEMEKEGATSSLIPRGAGGTTHLTIAAADTVYGPQNTQTHLASDTADNLLWDRFTRPSHAHSAAVVSALSRISFSQIASAQPLHQIVALVEREVARGGNLVVLAGRSRRMAVESHRAELQTLIAGKGAAIGSAVPKTLGDVGAAIVASGTSASLLVVQAAVAAA
ncbi:hypothetical protein B0H10DRAFT_2191867 [Mycena sp. CBHHK59/15]|nr:hypothetical protein B0H10DRAFT_2191867 [Mycena sp. CBHHK59/15]